MESERTMTGPSGKVYQLAGDTMPPAEQAQYNHDVTGAYLRDVLETAVASGPAELAPLFVGKAISDMVRSMSVAWLREFAYAGIIRRAEQLSDDALEGVLDVTPESDHADGPLLGGD